MAKTKPNTSTRGSELEYQLSAAIQELGQVPCEGARPLPVLTGLQPDGTSRELVDNVVLRALDLMRESKRVFLYGTSIVLAGERNDGAGRGLVTLCTGPEVAVGAEDLLCNVFLCGTPERQFAVPKAFTDLMLRSDLPWQHLPRIRAYATRPTYDEDFLLRGPGWHPGPGILVHSPAIEPYLWTSAPAGGSALNRLPPYLSPMLGDFCFASDADLVNAVALLLTGILANRFVAAGKPWAIIDGNQPSLGKTLLARAFGLVLDGAEPQPTAFNANDEELRKAICATLRGSAQSLLLLDNAKVRAGACVNSPTLEAFSTAPEIVMRILGRSENFTRPNDLTWLLTMNASKASPDRS